jgi:hypothetical protein
MKSDSLVPDIQYAMGKLSYGESAGWLDSRIDDDKELNSMSAFLRSSFFSSSAITLIVRLRVSQIALL